MQDRFESPAENVHAQAGVTLIETMLALSVLSIVLMGLGGMMFEAARHTRQSAAVAYLSSAVATAEAWSRALPWDSAPAAIGCADSLTTGQLVYTQCVELPVNTSKYQQIRVIISPAGNLVIKPDTVVVDRNRARSPSPFNAN